MIMFTRNSETIDGIKHAKALKDVSNVYGMTEDQFNDVSGYITEKFGYNNLNWKAGKIDSNGKFSNQPPTLEQAKRMEIEAVNACVDD